MELKAQRVGRKAKGLLGILEQAEACWGGELRILGNGMQRPSRYKVSVGMGAG